MLYALAGAAERVTQSCHSVQSDRVTNKADRVTNNAGPGDTAMSHQQALSNPIQQPSPPRAVDGLVKADLSQHDADASGDSLAITPAVGLEGDYRAFLHGFPKRPGRFDQRGTYAAYVAVRASGVDAGTLLEAKNEYCREIEAKQNDPAFQRHWVLAAKTFLLDRWRDYETVMDYSGPEPRKILRKEKDRRLAQKAQRPVW